MPSRRPPPILQVLPLDVGRGVRLVGELDIASAGALRRMLDSLPSGTEAVTVELAELSFMDSSGLHVFEEYAGTLNGGGPLVLVNVPPNIRRVFALTGVDQNPAIELRGGDEGG